MDLSDFYVGRTWPRERVIKFWERSGHIKIQNFDRSPFHCISNDFGFLVDITPEVIDHSIGSAH